MKTSRVSSNLCHLFLCLAVVFGLAQAEVFAAGGKSKSGGKEKQATLWEQIDASNSPARGQHLLTPRKYLTFRLNQTVLSELLAKAPREFTDAARNTEVVIRFPMPDGTFSRFRIEDSPIMAPALAARFPEIKTYLGRGIDDPKMSTRFDMSPRGFHALIISNDNTIVIQPYLWNDTSTYISYYGRDYKDTSKEAKCLVEGKYSLGRKDSRRPGGPAVPVGDMLRTFRVAIATTQEYTNDPALGGGTVAGGLASVNTWLNGVNAVFDRELSVRMNLVANDNLVIFTAENDGFTNGNNTLMVDEVRNVLRDTIGPANYDVGHVLGTSNNGGAAGIAYVRVICSESTQGGNGPLKGGASTLVTAPVGNPVGLFVFMHEFGHLFGGDHNFNVSAGPCAGQRDPTACEPGSGSTLMCYAGTCAPDNVEENSELRLHNANFNQIIAHITDMGGGGACAMTQARANNIPTINGGANFTIPRNTPFTLAATGGDADPGDVPNLTYDWEQNDAGGMTFGNPPYPDTGDPANTTRPIFRAFPPTAGASRTFPSLTYILNNANVPPPVIGGLQTAENLPNVTRTLNFRCTIRDQRGGVNDAAVVLNVDGGSGPFAVTTPNTAVTWQANTMQTVTWDVANTTAAPVSAANVKISLSIDGGQTFPATLLASTANNGTAQITVPDVTTTQTRIKIEGVNNIFFDISDVNFAITGGSGATPTPTSTPGTTPGSAANISTRLPVGTGDNILITGFIVTGPTGSTKRVLVRGIGPSTMVAGALADPTLELRDGTTALLASNDNWRTTVIGGIITADQVAEIQASTLAPTNDAESALIGTLAPGNYTAQIRGANNTTGIGLSEAYDLSLASAAKLANVSTRGFVQTGDNLMIGGFIVVNNPVRVVVRGIGPSLTAVGVPNALADPTLELRGVNGLILANDNWRDTQEAEITATGLAPTNNLESALVMTLQPGNYTAQLRGNNNGTGNGLVEIFALPTLP